MNGGSDDEGPFEAWARLDPAGVLPGVVRRARRVPGVRLLERGAGAVERRWLGVLRERIDEVAGLPAPSGPPPSPTNGSARAASRVPAVAAGPEEDPTPAELLDALLQTSMEQSAREGRNRQFTLILQRLVPDEARILAALADGAEYPLLHVVARSLPGTPERLVLENACTVGRRAGVVLPDRVPGYVTHLLAMGLTQTGAEDRSRTTEYEILETEEAVGRAKTEAAKLGRRGPGIVRQTLRISPLGAELWAAAQRTD